MRKKQTIGIKLYTLFEKIQLSERGNERKQKPLINLITAQS